jgi:hypothetical protein
MSHNDISNLSDTIVPKSDQLNADSLLSGPLTIMVTGVSRGNAEQPVTIHYADDNGMPYKPCKSMRKVLIFAWGDDGREWIGKSMTLYNNPDVKWGGVKVGGIRISHLSHIKSDIAISLASTKGKKESHTIKLLQVKKAAPAKPAAEQAPSAPDTSKHLADLKAAARQGMAALQAAWKQVPKAAKEAISPTGCPDDLKRIAKAADQPAPAQADGDGLAGLNAAAAAIADEPVPAADDDFDPETGEIIPAGEPERQPDPAAKQAAPNAVAGKAAAAADDDDF